MCFLDFQKLIKSPKRSLQTTCTIERAQKAHCLGNRLGWTSVSHCTYKTNANWSNLLETWSWFCFANLEDLFLLQELLGPSFWSSLLTLVELWDLSLPLLSILTLVVKNWHQIFHSFVTPWQYIFVFITKLFNLFLIISCKYV